MPADGDARLAVIDLGSNSFRLVVFESHSGASERGRLWWRSPDESEAPLGAWWKRTDEIYEPVRILAGAGKDGELSEESMERALRTIDIFAHFCEAGELGPPERVAVATSAIRDAPTGDELSERAREQSGLEIRVLSGEEEARYGYLAAVNSTSLRNGAVVELGGGSAQLVKVDDWAATEFDSWRLGAVRMTEKFLDGDGPATPKQLARLRKHVASRLEEAEWLKDVGGELVGVGGAIRNLAAAAQHLEGKPAFGVQGFNLKRRTLDELIELLAAMPVPERREVPGIKPARGDIILAGAIVVEQVLDASGFKKVRATEAGLREGIFLERLLSERPEPLFEDVRAASVINLASQYDPHARHTRHVAALALGLFDELGAAGLHPADPSERELLWAACLLHDIGVAINYDDHHKHSRYLILNAGLPGFSPREMALIGQALSVVANRLPSLGPFAALMKPGDLEILDRCSVLLRLAEDLERSRDQAVAEAHVLANGSGVELALVSEAPVPVARWAASRESELFEHAFGAPLRFVG
ncbi:MAG: HD domain-containing protein [Solirubrobacterales bacterium]